MEEPPSDAIGPEQAGTARTLVVCCVELDAAQLQPAFDVLTMRGFEIVVIERQDVGAAALVEHAQQHGDALFVLARAAESSEALMVPLEDALRTAAVETDRVSALVIDWRDPMALVEHVAGLVGRARTSDAADAIVPPAPTTRRRTLTVKVVPAELESPVTSVAVEREPLVAAVEPVVAAVEPVIAAAIEPLPPAIAIEPLPPVIAPFVAPTHVLADDAEEDDAGAGGSRSPWRWIASSRTRMLVVASAAMATVLAIAFFVGRDRVASDDDAQARAMAEATAAPQRSSASDSATDAAATPAAASPPNTSALVEEARARGDLGVHEGIVFAPVHASKRRFAAAREQCDEMNAGALKGWRMPTLAELHVLALAGVIDRGVYWSGTEEAAFGTHALIWSEKKSAAVPITKAWPGAHALCVRDEPPSR